MVHAPTLRLRMCRLPRRTSELTHTTMRNARRLTAAATEILIPVAIIRYAARHIGHFGSSARIALGTIQPAISPLRRATFQQPRALTRFAGVIICVFILWVIDFVLYYYDERALVFWTLFSGVALLRWALLHGYTPVSHATLPVTRKIWWRPGFVRKRDNLGSTGCQPVAF